MSLADVQKNAILARLPPPQQAAVEAAGELIDLDPGTLLHGFGQPTTSVIFPLHGVVSLVIPVSNGEAVEDGQPVHNGHTVEVALVGSHGVVGVGAFLGDVSNDLEAIAQIRGHGLRLSVSALSPDVRAVLEPLAARFAVSLMLEIAQTAGCNRLHSVEQRTARWLLQAADQAGNNRIELTHEFLAMMLAVRRASVTVVVGLFARAGLIDAKRGLISLSDRAGLEELACNCYNVIRASSPRYD